MEYWPWGSHPSGGGKEEDKERQKEKGQANSSFWQKQQEEESPTLSSSSFNKVVILACDATRVCNELELRLAVNAIRMRGGILYGGSTLLVLGVLHTVNNPSEICLPFSSFSSLLVTALVLARFFLFRDTKQTVHALFCLFYPNSFRWCMTTAISLFILVDLLAFKNTVPNGCCFSCKLANHD